MKWFTKWFSWLLTWDIYIITPKGGRQSPINLGIGDEIQIEDENEIVLKITRLGKRLDLNFVNVKYVEIEGLDGGAKQ